MYFPIGKKYASVDMSTYSNGRMLMMVIAKIILKQTIKHLEGKLS